MLADLVVPVAKDVRNASDGLQHLQRLIRKVQHVLVIKHCLDDLRDGGSPAVYQAGCPKAA
jgi:hypothetical protein